MDNINTERMNEKEIDYLAGRIVNELVLELAAIKFAEKVDPDTDEYYYESLEITEEDDLLSELAKVSTLINLLEDREEYEKCVFLKQSIKALQTKLEEL